MGKMRYVGKNIRFRIMLFYAIFVQICYFMLFYYNKPNGLLRSNRALYDKGPSNYVHVRTVHVRVDNPRRITTVLYSSTINILRNYMQNCNLRDP